MSTDGIVVLLLGIAAVAWVNWYFFFAQRTAAAATVQGGVQTVTVAVHGGYDPAQVRVKRGTPLRLVFDRQETSSCSEEVVFPDFDVRRFLPAHQKTAVEITPARAGTFEFTCGMGMLRGKLIVEE